MVSRETYYKMLLMKHFTKGFVFEAVFVDFRKILTLICYHFSIIRLKMFHE